MTADDDQARLVRALGRHADIEDWTVRLTSTRSAWRAWGDRDQRGAAERTHLAGELHRDQPKGRGSATFALAADGDAQRVIDDAMVRADDATGPVWRTPSPAAPAKVELADPAIDPSALAAQVDALAAAVDAAAGGATIVRALVEIAVDELALSTRRGRRAGWRATRVELSVEVRHAGATGQLERRARRLVDLDLAGGFAAARIAASRASAAPAPPGVYEVVLRAAALLHGGTGLLDAVIAQADPDLDRQGLVRYHVGKPIADGATLSLDSDGTLPFGWWSAPLGDAGEPVRRFPIVTDGVATGLGLDAREAALRGAQPNGGVRGLVVPPGTTDDLIAPTTLVVDELAWLEVEPTTGWFRAAIAGGTIGITPVGGGILRGDALALVARARRSRAVIATPRFRGPALWHLGALAVE